MIPCYSCGINILFEIFHSLLIFEGKFLVNTDFNMIFLEFVLKNIVKNQSYGVGIPGEMGKVEI